MLAALLAAASLMAPPAPAQIENPERILAEVSVNGEAQGVSLLIRTRAGFHADGKALARWRLAVPATAGFAIDGIDYFPLDGYPGIDLRFDTASMRLAIDVPPELLPTTQRSLRRAASSPDHLESVGGFMDYDLSLVRGSAAAGQSVSGLLQPTIFTGRGSLRSELLYNSAGGAYGSAEPGWLRLQTAWVMDDPSRMRTLRFGDAVTQASPWGRALRFGGFQIASNFDTRPTEVTFPLPTISGTAALPSSLDIFVNGQMRSRVDVPGGVFEINDIPVVTGAGQVQVVARDLLGREQVIATDFYATESLLRPGLSEYSLSVGRLREEFARSSNDYGDALVSGLLRRGISERLTVTGQLETTGSLTVAGAGLSRTVGRAGLTSIGVAVSSGAAEGATPLSAAAGSGSTAGLGSAAVPDGAAVTDGGSLWLVGHQYQGRRFRADIRIQGTTAGFTQAGLELGQAYPRRQLTLSTGVNLRGHGSLGLAFVRERAHAGREREISSLSYSRSLPYRMLLAVVLSRIEIESAHTEASLTLSRSLGPRSSTSMNFARLTEGRRLRFDHRYELPAGPGFGYRTSIETGLRPGAEAELLVNRDYGRYSAEYRGRDGDGALRLQSRGSIARFGGAWFATRSIDNGFAIVDAGGLDDVQIYLENRPIGATRDDGRLLVPGLRPYETNRLRIDTENIPIFIRVDSPVLAVTPYYRAGTLASFGVRRTSSVLVRVLGPDGRPLPEGARGRVGGGDFDRPIGLDGRLYLEGVAAGQLIEVMTQGRICRFELPPFDLDAAIANLGDRSCAFDSIPARAGDDR